MRFLEINPKPHPPTAIFQVYGFLWASETISGLKEGYWRVSWDNEMVLKTYISWIYRDFLLKIAIVTKIFQYVFSFLSWTKIIGQRDVLILRHGLLDRYFETTNGFETFLLIFIFQFFLYDLLTKNARKLELTESNPIMENVPIFLSLSVR